MITEFNQTSNQSKIDEVKKYLSYLFVVLFLIIIQINALDLIAIRNATPNIILLAIVWIVIENGYFAGIISAFVIGLLYDFFTVDIIGTNALSNIVMALFLGVFHKTEKQKQLLSDFRIIPIIFLASLIHNFIYGVFYVNAGIENYMMAYIEYAIASAFYTSAFGIFLYALANRRKTQTEN